jgi:DNA-directed RNA polymerase subunit beta
LINIFGDVDNNPDRMFITSTLYQEPEWETNHNHPISQLALLEFFKRMRPGDPATIENAKGFLEEQLFDQRHYDLERVGRYKLNQKLELYDHVSITHRTVTKWDVIRLIRRMIMINNGTASADDIDHLGNRRAKTVGELHQSHSLIFVPLLHHFESFLDQASFHNLWIKQIHLLSSGISVHCLL